MPREIVIVCMKKLGMAIKTDFTRVARPAKESLVASKPQGIKLLLYILNNEPEGIKVDSLVK